MVKNKFSLMFFKTFLIFIGRNIKRNINPIPIYAYPSLLIEVYGRKHHRTSLIKEFGNSPQKNELNSALYLI